MSKEVDEAFEEWRIRNKSVSKQAYDSAVTVGRTTERARCVAAVEAYLIRSRNAGWQNACELILAAIRGEGGGKEEKSNG